MNDQTQTETTQETMGLQDVARKSFGADDLTNAQNYIGQVVEACNGAGVKPVFNFDTDAELPEGYGLSVIPLTERVTGQGNVTKGVCIAAVPSVNTILSADSGENWVVNQINSILLRSIKSAATPSDDGSISSIPFKVEDFTTSTRSSALAAFNAVASLYVAALKQKGLKFMSKALLRQVLSSADFAAQQFPKIDQENWQVVLKSMMAHASKEGIDSGILTHWANTRNEVEVSTADIDLSDIDGMVD